MATAKKESSRVEISVEEKLVALYTLQVINSEIDRIQTVRGELPLEVQDLADEVEGLQTRLEKHNQEVKDLETSIAEKRNSIKEAKESVRKYDAQQTNVRNNREYDSLSKEIEFQGLEIQLAEKRIKEFTEEIESKNLAIESAVKELEERKGDLEHKKKELDEITKETEKDEESLQKKAKTAEKKIEERLLTAFTRIRSNARNGLAVVSIERDACGGCFNKIPPQRQLDIKTNKKIIVCEHCGRILVDDDIAENIKKKN